MSFVFVACYYILLSFDCVCLRERERERGHFTVLLSLDWWSILLLNHEASDWRPLKLGFYEKPPFLGHDSIIDEPIRKWWKRVLASLTCGHWLAREAIQYEQKIYLTMNMNLTNSISLNIISLCFDQTKTRIKMRKNLSKC